MSGTATDQAPVLGKRVPSPEEVAEPEEASKQRRLRLVSEKVTVTTTMVTTTERTFDDTSVGSVARDAERLESREARTAYMNNLMYILLRCALSANTMCQCVSS